MLISIISASPEEENPIASHPGLRKLKDRQTFIDFLVPNIYTPTFTNTVDAYKFYGCYCLPSISNTRTPTKGLPIDEIDAACKRAHQCYFCANKHLQENFNETCIQRSTSFEYEFVENYVDGSFIVDRDIICLNDPNLNSKNLCKRSICECEKKLANDLTKLAHLYNPKFHQKTKTLSTDGTTTKFNAEQNCNQIPKISRKSSDPTIVCCGDYTNGGTFYFKSHFGSRKCCVNKSYDAARHTCCDGKVSDFGEC